MICSNCELLARLLEPCCRVGKSRIAVNRNYLGQAQHEGNFSTGEGLLNEPGSA